MSGSVPLQGGGGYREDTQCKEGGWTEGECGTESGWMGRQSVQVSPDVRLLNSGELEKVSAGHLRAVPRSHSHPFVTISSKTQQTPSCGGSRDTTGMGNKGNVWDVGTGSIPWGKANYRLKAPCLSVACSSDKMKVPWDQYQHFCFCRHKK